MSQSILNELDFLAHTFLLGVTITALYDTIRIVRRVIKHTTIWIAMEDMGFWIFCSISIFNMLIEENHGILRWFAVLGSLLGMIVFKSTVSKIYVKYTVFIITWLIRWIDKLIGFLIRPICFFYQKLKNALTRTIKMVRIKLCKHHGLTRGVRRFTRGDCYGKKKCLSEEETE